MSAIGTEEREPQLGGPEHDGVELDAAEFDRVARRHRDELQLHCYRMLGTLQDAEDTTQETLLHAWRSREDFAGAASVRTWLFRIATNACLDVIRRRNRRPVVLEPVSHPAGTPDTPVVSAPWVEPYPDTLLDRTQSIEDQVIARETIELAFIVALQHLPPRQRAVFTLHDVLGWSAKETAAAVGTTTAAANSALQRAREAVRTRMPAQRSEWQQRATVSEDERGTVARFIAAIESGDDRALRRLLHVDARIGHQPFAGGHVGAEPAMYAGLEQILEAWAPLLHADHPIGVRMLPTTANRQPAVASYTRMPDRDSFEAFALNVFRIDYGLITEEVSFRADVFDRFGLPTSLD